MRFTKLAETPENHYALLLRRGLEISDPDRFYKYLKNIGYYRLSGYMYPFQLADGSHSFKPGIHFDTILQHYLFDKKLRFLVLDVIERIEISLRANISNTLALHFGPHWFLSGQYFNQPTWHEKFIDGVRETIRKSNEDFIRQYQLKYSDPSEPPGWMIMETVTFGEMASLYENLKDGPEKKEIAAAFHTQVSILESWLRSINFIRNACAHHSRLWNRKLPVKPLIPVRKNNRFLENMNEDTNKRLYGVLRCMLYLLKVISPQTTFSQRLKALFSAYPEVNIHYMGFPDDWQEEELWKES